MFNRIQYYFCTHVIGKTSNGETIYPVGRTVRANAKNYKSGIRTRIIREFRCQKCKTTIWELR